MKHIFSISFDFDGIVPRALIEEKLNDLVLRYIGQGYFDCQNIRVVDFDLAARHSAQRATHH